jgi:hypothetical protein
MPRGSAGISLRGGLFANSEAAGRGVVLETRSGGAWRGLSAVCSMSRSGQFALGMVVTAPKS